MYRFRDDKDESAELPPHVREELERMSQMVAKAMEPMRQVTEAFNRSGIFEVMATVAKAAKQHAEYVNDWNQALTLPAVRKTESIVLHRIERSPQAVSISDEDKREIVDALIKGLKEEMLKPIPRQDPIVDLFLEGNAICRIWEGKRLRYALSEQRKKLLTALTYEPQDRDVLMDATDSPSEDAFYQLVKGTNDQIKARLHLAESVVVNEVGYFINGIYSLRRVDC